MPAIQEFDSDLDLDEEEEKDEDEDEEEEEEKPSRKRQARKQQHQRGCRFLFGLSVNDIITISNADSLSFVLPESLYLKPNSSSSQQQIISFIDDVDEQMTPLKGKAHQLLRRQRCVKDFATNAYATHRGRITTLDPILSSLYQTDEDRYYTVNCASRLCAICRWALPISQCVTCGKSIDWHSNLAERDYPMLCQGCFEQSRESGVVGGDKEICNVCFSLIDPITGLCMMPTAPTEEEQQQQQQRLPDKVSLAGQGEIFIDDLARRLSEGAILWLPEAQTPPPPSMIPSSISIIEL